MSGRLPVCLDLFVRAARKLTISKSIFTVVTNTWAPERNHLAKTAISQLCNGERHIIRLDRLRLPQLVGNQIAAGNSPNGDRVRYVDVLTLMVSAMKQATEKMGAICLGAEHSSRSWEAELLTVHPVPLKYKSK